jgi:FkbM family methyltransferase
VVSFSRFKVMWVMLSRLLRFLFGYTFPGRTTFYRLVRGLLALVRGKDSTIRFETLINGHKLLLHLCPSDYVDSQVITRGYYEQHVLDELLTAPENGIVWDIGANIGLHTAAVALIRPDIDIVAVEANPLIAKRLLANVGSYQNVDVYVCGLSQTVAFLPFSILSSGNSGQSSFRPWGHVGYERVVHVSTFPATSIPSNLPDVVKIDVEGFELEVLQGFGSLLGDVNKYVIETCNPEGVIELLGKDRFSCRHIGPSGLPDYVFERIVH